MNKVYKLLKKYHLYIFVLYVVILVLVLILKFPSPIFFKIIGKILTGKMNVYTEDPNFIPFKTISYYVASVQTINDWFFKNLACNILMFVPVGFLLPFFTRIKKWWQVFISGIFLSVILEFVQWITKFGTVDIDDVILNTVGIFIGYAIYLLLVNVVKIKEET